MKHSDLNPAASPLHGNEDQSRAQIFDRVLDRVESDPACDLIDLVDAEAAACAPRWHGPHITADAWDRLEAEAVYLDSRRVTDVRSV